MAVDATGAPSTNFAFPKYNPDADAPSGLGLNNIIDDIDTKLKDRFVQSTDAEVLNDVPVWNGSAWVLQKITAAQLDTGVAGMALIASTLLAVDTADITFSSIPGAYKELVLIGSSRTTDTVSSPRSLYLQFNSDTGANYAYQRLSATGVTVSTAASVGQTQLELGLIPYASDAANIVGSVHVTIPLYALTTDHKNTISTFKAFGSAAHYVGQVGGSWQSTAAITSIRLFPGVGSFKAGAQYSLYGIG